MAGQAAQLIAQVEYTPSPLSQASQLVAQVEYEPNESRMAQLIAQVEYEPNESRMAQLIAQAEYVPTNEKIRVAATAFQIEWNIEEATLGQENIQAEFLIIKNGLQGNSLIKKRGNIK